MTKSSLFEESDDEDELFASVLTSKPKSVEIKQPVKTEKVITNIVCTYVAT